MDMSLSEVSQSGQSDCKLVLAPPHTKTARKTTFFIVTGLSFSPSPGRFNTCDDIFIISNKCVHKKTLMQAGCPALDKAT